MEPQPHGAGTGYSCKVVSWDDVSRGTVGGSLSCWGANITDARLAESSQTQFSEGARKRGGFSILWGFYFQGL